MFQFPAQIRRAIYRGERHRITELLFAENYENPCRLSIGRLRHQTVMARIAEYREKVDNANSELEFGDESNGDTF